MPRDSDVSRRKHRRSSPSDEEADKSSKRHKHRHHRHHRSEKHVEETKQEDMDSPAPHAVSAGDDDVEEGEILEEDKDVELRDVESDSLNLGVEADKSGNGVVTKSNSNVKLINEPSFSVDSKVDKFHTNPEAHANGDLYYEYKEDDKRRHGRSSRKKTSYPYVDSVEGDSVKLSGHQKSSSEWDKDKRKIVEHSPSCKAYDEEVRTRRRSLSRDISRERSCSRSVLEEEEEEEEEAKRRRFHGRADNDSDDGRITTRNSHHSSRDLMRDMERERSGGYSRYFEEDREMTSDRAIDRNLRRDSHREGSRYRDMERDQRIERGQEESRDRDGRRVRDRDWSRDRDMDRDRRRERERERSRDRELERDWRREKGRERSRDWEVDRDWRREKDRERSRDRELERERIREKERERSKDREVDVERREKKRDRSKEREKESDKYRQRDRDRSKDIYHARGSERDREREKDSDRYRDRFRDGDDRESQKERERRNEKNRDIGRDRRSDSEKVHISNSDSSVGRDKLSRDEDEQDDFEEKISLKLAEQEEEDLNRIKEESRKRRQAILEKYKKQQLQQQENQTKGVEKDEESGRHPAEAPQVAKVVSESPDGRIDGGDAAVADPLFSVGKSPAENGVQALQRASGVAGLGEGTPKSERSNDKYCDDIFGETPAGVRKTGKEDCLPVIRGSFHDNWDDPEGYYSYRFGEILDGRYEVAAAHGKGVFSTVVRAKDLKASAGDPEEVAIKIIRNNETMNKAGKEEVQILKKLAALDPENKRHCVRFVSSLKYRNHLCLVFESLHMNLREVLKKFGRNIGLKLTAVRAYAKQLFIALKHLKNCGVLHCDIKPDNMLVNEAKNVLKLCDFGNAMSAGKNEITPYLVSRFYRAPEIILGLPYNHPMDMWSVGCCLYELYNGKVLFPGPTNNDMLRLHMELKGPFPKKMLKKGAFVDQHFDQDLHFLATEEDPVTKKTVNRLLVNIKPKDIGSIITGSPGEDPKMLANFKDLLDKIFVLDPEKRMTVQQALAHPFITGK